MLGSLILGIFTVGFGVLARVGVEVFGDCFGVASTWVVGEDEGEDASVAVDDVVDEAGLGFCVFDLVCSDGECEAFGVVEGDGAGEFVLEFVVERVLLLVAFEAVVFLSSGEENEVAWIAEVQAGAAVASQGVVVRFSNSYPLIKNIEITIDGSPVDADLVAECCVLEFFTGVGGGDGAEAVEVFGSSDGPVLGELFVEEEQEVGFGEFVPDRWVVRLVKISGPIFTGRQSSLKARTGSRIG